MMEQKAKVVRDLEQLNKITYRIIGASYQIHSELGPGLLESSYEVCLAHELRELGFHVERQKLLPVVYKNIYLDAGYRIDLIVEHSVIVEVKSVQKILPIDKAQLMTYLKLSKVKLGLLLNFNVVDMKQGIHRFAM